MTNKLIKRFLNPENHASGGTLSSTVGLVCNVFLFTIKFLMGLISQSVAIISDAFNNLSDCVSCLVTLFGYRLASRPADAGHPFGHGRIEYMISQVISALIILVGIELFKTSWTRIFNPVELVFSWWVIGGLTISIGVKIWMGFFNRKISQLTNSSVMAAVSSDSFSDAASTSVTLISYLVAPLVSFPLDGIVGLAVSVLILIGGIKIMANTISELLGEPCDEKTIEKILNIIADTDGILGVHDLLIHNYGPTKQVGSAHVEVDGYQSVSQAHNIIDRLERRLYRETNIEMVLHMDPVIPDDKRMQQAKSELTAALKQIDSQLSFHDFRIISHRHPVWSFDLVVPYADKRTPDELKTQLYQLLDCENRHMHLDIHFDRNILG